MKKLLKFNVKPAGVQVLLWGALLLALFAVLNWFGVFSGVTAMQLDIVMLLAVVFLAVEMGVMSMFTSKKKKGIMNWVGAVVVILALLLVLGGWIGFTFAWLEGIRGIVMLLLFVFIIYELFKK